MKPFLATIAAVVLLPLAAACAAGSGAIPATAAAPSGFEDVDVRLSSTKIPGCLSEGESFEIFVTTTLRAETQQDSATFAWRHLPNSPNIVVTDTGQGKEFILRPTQVASFTITVNLINETGTAQPYAAKIPLFRFDAVDEKGFACFSWVD